MDPNHLVDRLLCPMVGKRLQSILPLISELDSWDPESTIFTIGVTLTALCIFIRTCQLHQTQDRKIRHHHFSQRWSILNHLTLIPGLITVVSVGVLAHVPWNQDIRLHMKLAKAIFEWGTLWCLLMTCVSWKCSHQNNALRQALRWRLLGSVTTAIGLVGITISSTNFLEITRIHCAKNRTIIGRPKLFLHSNALYQI